MAHGGIIIPMDCQCDLVAQGVMFDRATSTYSQRCFGTRHLGFLFQLCLLLLWQLSFPALQVKLKVLPEAEGTMTRCSCLAETDDRVLLLS